MHMESEQEAWKYRIFHPSLGGRASIPSTHRAQEGKGGRGQNREPCLHSQGCPHLTSIPTSNQQDIILGPEGPKSGLSGSQGVSMSDQL